MRIVVSIDLVDELINQFIVNELAIHAQRHSYC